MTTELVAIPFGGNDGAYASAIGERSASNALFEHEGELESRELLLDFNPTFDSLKQRAGPISLSWKDLTYKIKGKTIVNGVSGRCKPGQVLGKIYTYTYNELTKQQPLWDLLDRGKRPC